MIEKIGVKAPVACAPYQTTWLELRDLQHALTNLPEDQRSVLLLIGVEGKKYDTVASVLGIPIGTVQSHVARGRANLRASTGRGPSSYGCVGAARSRAAV